MARKSEYTSSPHGRPAVFRVHPARRFEGKFPFDEQPKEIGCFSLDADRFFYDDKSQLKWLHMPENVNNVNFNLRDGYKVFRKRDDSVKYYIDELLRWILVNRKKFLLPGQDEVSDGAFPPNLHTDFVCWRGLLTKLLCTPYENKDGWLIAVTKFNGTYYLCEYDTPERIVERENMSERQDEMCYWGHKFEQYMVAAKPDGQPDTCVPVNNYEAFCLVVRRRLKEHSLVFAGKTDCYDAKEKCYVEFKTSREIYQPNQDRNLKRFKLIKWWAQSFLPAVPKVICGFRDDDGVVRRLKTYRTLDMPNIAKHIPNPWDPAVCMNFCDQFLTFVKQVVLKDDPKIVYMFKWYPRQDITWTEHPQDSKFTFLPSWFTNPDQQGNSGIKLETTQQA
ncbi:decapping and exoribonuclease protein isoform X1 [Lingula anatina]|uniref:Decapping nuclease n=1 Tax=Lingula anatina TaxID=7574 RepID=A0A1S3JQS7_LINAN|nr:decapping and exoribonuclease protein isoform X1 [Lingula anatina]|eukprot:XP_013412715.1 decapping and exoribonuclease protein isoform X1 [Lingula anatina]